MFWQMILPHLSIIQHCIAMFSESALRSLPRTMGRNYISHSLSDQWAGHPPQAYGERSAGIADPHWCALWAEEEGGGRTCWSHATNCEFQAARDCGSTAGGSVHCDRGCHLKILNELALFIWQCLHLDGTHTGFMICINIYGVTQGEAIHSTDNCS